MSKPSQPPYPGQRPPGAPPFRAPKPQQGRPGPLKPGPSVNPATPRPDEERRGTPQAKGPVGKPEPISPQPQRDVDPRRPHFAGYPVPVVTTETLPGQEIADVVGLVIGVTTRPRDMAHHPEMAFVNTAARQDAIAALVRQAQEAGAHAVVGVRFDSGKISETVTELTAYGTAVRLVIKTD